eukprot:jgi/Tetstr1/431679/TSEL_021207.t1
MHTALKNLWASVAIDAGAVLDRDRSGAGDLTLDTSGLGPTDRSRPSDLTLAGHAAFIDPRDWIDYPPQAYAESTPHVGLTNPGLWNPRNDERDRYLTVKKKHATRDEYRHMLCYGVFTTAAHAALTDVVATLRAKNATARDTADANDLLDSAIRTIATNEERVAERLPYSRFFDTTAAERSNIGVDGLLNAQDDKILEVSLHQAAKAQAAAQFKGSGSGGSGGGSGDNIRIKEQERAEHADRATKERADKNKDKDKIKGKPQPGNPARKTSTPQTEEQK